MRNIDCCSCTSAEGKLIRPVWPNELYETACISFAKKKRENKIAKLRYDMFKNYINQAEQAEQADLIIYRVERGYR